MLPVSYTHLDVYKRQFGDTLVEDYKIRKTLKKQLYAAGVPKIEICLLYTSRCV